MALPPPPSGAASFLPTLSFAASPLLPPPPAVPSVKKPKAPKKKGKDDKERKTRSRAACLPCKSTKQKCDGPSRIPCRRCQLYGLDCKFPSSLAILGPPRPATNQGSTDAGPSSGGSSNVVTQKLYEIAERLKSIESALNIDDDASMGTSPMHESSHSPSVGRRSPSPSSSDEGNEERNNPIQMINQSLDEVVGKPLTFTPQGSTDDYGAPDALRRSLLTPKECQELFDFFFLSIHPWVMMLSLDEDRDALGVRSRSPLLFHTILLLASSYSNPFPSHLHASLITFTNAILAPQILSPQPHELTTDFLRAIDLLNLYKPVQFAARRAEGKNDSDAMRASKVNGLASWMLQGILARTAERLELAASASKFMKAYAQNKDPKDIPAVVLRDLRLFYWLLCNDVHGNVQSGRRCNMDGDPAMPTTRIFSSLQLQPYDVRLAASVEMFEVARPILRSRAYERSRRITRADLERFNSGMAAWEEFWLPVLQQQLAVDPLAMSVLCPFQLFITLTYNASSYLSWQSNRMYHSDSGAEASDTKSARKLRTEARGLSAWEFEALEKCVRAAESLVFTLCEESRVKGGWRSVQWREAERVDGWRKLALDQSVVELSSWGMDAITCVAYIFPLVFLSKLVNDGILTVDLVLMQTPTAQPPWQLPRKLPRLLELGASFLGAIALNPNHPAVSQAHVLRTILDAGLRGVSPSPQATVQMPRHGDIVLSPSSNPAPVGFSSTDSSPKNNQWAATPQLGSAYTQYGQLPGALQVPMMPATQPGPSAPVMDTESLTAVLEGYPQLFGDMAFWQADNSEWNTNF